MILGGWESLVWKNRLLLMVFGATSAARVYINVHQHFAIQHLATNYSPARRYSTAAWIRRSV